MTIVTDVINDANMFVWIHFGDNQKLMVNANCNTNNFINFLRSKCHCELVDSIDLCDGNGQLLNLCDAMTSSKVIEIIEPRCTYVLCFLEKDDSEVVKSVKPHLENVKEHYPNLLEALWQQFQAGEDGKSKRRDAKGRGAKTKEITRSVSRKSKK